MNASELEPTERWCTWCERRLKGKVRMLEFDQRFQTYHDCGDVPEDKSLGWWPFGIACAKRKQREEIIRRCHA